MKVGSRNSLSHRFKLRDKQFRNRLSVFALCVFFATLFWLIVQFSKDYEETIVIPLTFENSPKGRVLSSVSDTSLNVRVSLKGLRIIALRYFESPGQLRVNMAELKLRKETNGVYNSMLLTRQLIQSISDQVRISGKVVAISPDTLFLKFERIKTRRLPVKPHVSFSLAPQVMLYDSMACVPDSIDVKGPAAILDTLGYISTRHIQAGEITRNNTLTADLVYPVKHIPLIFSSTQVKINIFAEKFTETSVEVPVAPDTSGNCKIRTFPEKCIITVMVPLREFKNIDQTQFKLTVSCHEAATATGSNLQVRVGSLPRHTRLVRIEPQNVEFIILD